MAIGWAKWPASNWCVVSKTTVPPGGTVRSERGQQFALTILAQAVVAEGQPGGHVPDHAMASACTASDLAGVVNQHGHGEGCTGQVERLRRELQARPVAAAAFGQQRLHLPAFIGERRRRRHAHAKKPSASAASSSARPTMAARRLAHWRACAASSAV